MNLYSRATLRLTVRYWAGSFFWRLSSAFLAVCALLNVHIFFWWFYGEKPTPAPRLPLTRNLYMEFFNECVHVYMCMGSGGSYLRSFMKARKFVCSTSHCRYKRRELYRHFEPEGLELPLTLRTVVCARTGRSLPAVVDHVYVCIYIYACVCTCVHVYVHVHACISECECVCAC